MTASFLLKLDKLILFRQTLFGLPWTLSGAFLATTPCSFSRWLLLLFAFVTARSSGMCFNRLIDRHIDAKNPRTASRVLPAGEISPLFCLAQAVGFLFLFLFSGYLLGPSCFILAALASILMFLYPYTKRMTILCHLVLGVVQFFGPVAAWIAVGGGVSPIPYLLGFALLCSIAASDILYACQDIDFDRSEKLFSIPSRFGEKSAKRIAAFLYLVTVSLLLIVAKSYHSFFSWAVVLQGVIYVIALRLADKDKSFRFANIASAACLLIVSIGEYLCALL